MKPASIDLDALLVALVVAPSTYSRNRFFDMYQEADVRRVRRRASQVRSVSRHVTSSPEITPAAEGRYRLTYEVASVGMRRTMLLDPLELSLIRLLAARREGRPLPQGDPDRSRIDAALRGLAGMAGGEPRAAE